MEQTIHEAIESRKSSSLTAKTGSIASLSSVATAEASLRHTYGDITSPSLSTATSLQTSLPPPSSELLSPKTLSTLSIAQKNSQASSKGKIIHSLETLNSQSPGEGSLPLSNNVDNVVTSISMLSVCDSQEMPQSHLKQYDTVSNSTTPTHNIEKEIPTNVNPTAEDIDRTAQVLQSVNLNQPVDAKDNLSTPLFEDEDTFIHIQNFECSELIEGIGCENHTVKNVLLTTQNQLKGEVNIGCDTKTSSNLCQNEDSGCMDYSLM